MDPRDERPDALLALTTVGTREDGGRLARGLVESRLCACVSVVPGVESTFRWKGAIQTEAEFLLLIKTTRERIQPIREWLLAHHPYELPELLVFGAESGEPRYLAWLRQETSPLPMEDP